MLAVGDGGLRDKTRVGDRSIIFYIAIFEKDAQVEVVSLERGCRGILGRLKYSGYVRHHGTETWEDFRVLCGIVYDCYVIKCI